MPQLIVNGFFITVEKDQLNDFCNLMKQKKFDVSNASDWKPKDGKRYSSLCNFKMFINKAEEYSDMKTPDILQFCKNAWSAASLCVDIFYVKNFHILIKSNQARSTLFKIISAGCNSNDAFVLGETWAEAERAYNNIFNMHFLIKKERDDLLSLINKMNNILDLKCNIQIVGDKLKNLNTVIYKNVEGDYDISKVFFKYKSIAI